MNKEILNYVIRNRKPVTQESLRRAKVDVSRQADVYFSGRIFDTTRINLETINATYDYVVGQFYDSIQQHDQLQKSFQSINSSIGLRFSKLFRDIEKANAELQAMQVLHRDAAGYTKTFNIDLESKSQIDFNNSTAQVRDGLILGVPTEPSPSSFKYVSVNQYYPGNMSVQLQQISMNQAGGVFIEDMSIDQSSDIAVINSGQKFYALAQSKYDTPAEMSITIDRKEFSEFDNVELKFTNAFIVDILVQRTGDIFTKLTDKEFYAKEVNIKTVDKQARYIKLVLNFAKPSYQDGGFFIYKADFEYMNLIRQTIEGEYSVLTPAFGIEGQYGAVSLGVCDNQISSTMSKVNIAYYLQINGGDFERIRPANALHVGEELLQSSFKLPRYVASDTIKLTGKLTNQGFFQFEVGDKYGKMYATSERIFGRNITYTAQDWSDSESYYECFGLLEKAKTIDFGVEPVEVNGTWVSGKHDLSDGIYRIRTFKENYLNIFNTWKAKKVVYEALGLYTIDDGRQNEITVMDPKYPNNHKVIVEQQFDAIFAEELKEVRDYSWHITDAGVYEIHTQEEYKDGIHIVYRPHTKSLNTIKLKAVMQSVDKITVPIISKIMLRLS